MASITKLHSTTGAFIKMAHHFISSADHKMQNNQRGTAEEATVQEVAVAVRSLRDWSLRQSSVCHLTYHYIHTTATLPLSRLSLAAGGWPQKERGGEGASERHRERERVSGGRAYGLNLRLHPFPVIHSLPSVLHLQQPPQYIYMHTGRQVFGRNQVTRSAVFMLV